MPSETESHAAQPKLAYYCAAAANRSVSEKTASVNLGGCDFYLANVVKVSGFLLV
jgi:hypothetical protein